MNSFGIIKRFQVFNRLDKTHDHEVSTPSYIQIQLKMDRCENILLNGCLWECPKVCVNLQTDVR